MNEDTLLTLMLEQATDHALMLLDDNGTVIAWLMGSAKLFGYERAEVLGRTIEHLFTPEDRERKAPAAELEIARGYGTAEDDRWMLRKDGTRFWASGMVTRLRDQDGNIAGFSKFLRDRTDTRGQIEALRNRGDALAEEDRRKTVMLGTLAHELRNPLGVLANAVSLIELAYPDDPKLSYATQLIQRQSRFLSSLVEDLLEVVRVQAGKIVMKTRKIVLKDLLGEAAESAGASIQQKGQRIEFVLPHVPVILDADPTRLRQVFVNLLSNASKFSTPGATIFITCLTEGDEAVVRVKDQGRGIPADLLPHVFDLFSQGEGSARDGAAGLGLGLSIVKEYVELHGGSVQARSEGAGLGTEIVVRLPLAESVQG
ncbi:MAG: PAS domain-containing sensor histidine kinase [Burkholderiales bacterium]